MTDHPITPSPELAQQWINEYLNEHPDGLNVEVLVVSAAQWGADQELEACCVWLEGQTFCGHRDLIPSLRAARRPKPTSLKEQALAALQEAAYMADDIPPQGICSDQIDTICRALEALPDD